MADNLLKAVLDAIAESDNEIGGNLITRLTEVHEFGGNNGRLTGGSAELFSVVSIFKPTDVGIMVDVLEKVTPTGNQGSYRIKTYTNTQRVILENLDGSVPTFVSESDVRWRLSSLRVESAFEFPQRDKLMSLWTGREPERVPYGGVDLTPGAQQFLGLGEQVGRNDGRIDLASPNTLNGWAEGTFQAGDIGKAIWILPADGTPTGNEGVRVVSTVPDSKTVTLTGPAFVADEFNVAWRKKTYAESGYLTMSHREDSEVVDASGSYSAIDRLRRAMLIEYAEGEELDRIGRRYGVTRPRGLQDESFRRVLMVLPYMAKTTVYSLELLLAALFPQGGWSVYEDLISHPNEVFIGVPLLDPSEDYEGKAYLDNREDLASDSPTQVTVTDEPITIISVRLAPFLQQLEFDSLPSAETPAWTFVTQGASEGGTFSAGASKVLVLTLNGIATGGYYQLSKPEIDPENWDLTVWFDISTSIAAGGYPWKLSVEDGEREISLMWNPTQAALGQAATEAVVAGPVAGGAGSGWHRFKLQRRGDVVTAYRDGNDIFGKVAASDFAASSNRRFQFGFWSNGQLQNSISAWRYLMASTEGVRDYWNLRRDDGALSNPDTLDSASGLFLPGDSGRKVRLYSTDNENDGIWLATYSSATQLLLSGVQRGLAGKDFEDAARVEGQTGVGDGALVTLETPLFSRRDVLKDLTISGSSSGNDGTYEVLEYVSPYQVKVQNFGGFTAESDLVWEYTPNFNAESNVRWEMIETGTSVAKVLTIRDALPTNADVRVWYTVVPSGQILLNEFVTNKGEAIGAPDLYYPAYLYDIDSATRQLIDEITAAGVIPRYQRDY